jgi:hypothetical protein
MNSLRGFNSDVERETMIRLIKRFQQRALTEEEALHLIPLLEKEWNRAISDDNLEFAEKLANMIIALNAYVAGRVTLSKEDLNRIAI